MTTPLSKQLESITSLMGHSFTLHNKPLSYQEIFSETGLLPALARRADQLCSLCLGYGIGATFEKSEGSVLGTKVIFDEITPTILRVLCLIDVISELIKNSRVPGAVPLDELMYD